ncbi:glutathione S-transferase family protein [Minwuia sp.]|uniref:glutathione S-transferase family protein n=1 Tax=Minwuia sp. TaxID=2493630 RepID=UPI003A94D6DE
MGTYTLYGAECSYYSAKIRSYLRCKRIPYRERTNADEGYRERARVAVGFDVIPIMETPDGEIVQDTVDMIDHLEPLFPDVPAYPTGAVTGWAARFLATYASHGLIRAGLHFRWSYRQDNLDFIHHEFGRTILPNGPESEQVAMGVKIARRITSFLPFQGVVPETVEAIEDSCIELMRLMDRHFEAHPYLLGGQPTLADYAMTGPFYGHFARDPYPSNLMKRIAPNLFRWTERMNWPDMAAEFADYPVDLFADDAIPETLKAIIAHAASDFSNELSQTLDSMDAWFGGNPQISTGMRLPAERGAGYMSSHVLEVHGVPMSVPIKANIQWEHQKAADFYDSLTDRSVLDGLLADCGLLDLMQRPIARRIRRQDFGFVAV